MKNTSWAFTYLSRFLALLGFCSVSYAQGAFSGVSGSTCYPTPAAYCQTLIPSNPPSDWSNIHLVNTNNYQCNIAGNYSGTSMWYTNPQYFPCVPPTPSPTPTPQPCPKTSGPSGVAATGYCIWSQNSQGADYCVKFKGKSYLEWYNSLPVGTCIDGCDYNVYPDADDGYYYYKHDQPKVNGWTQVGYTYTTKGTGRTCQSPPFDPNEPPPNLSMPPQSCGEVNGQKVCFDAKPPTGTDGIDIKEETKPNSDGTKTETKTETTCVGNTCETTKTETTKDASGNTTGSTTTTTTENKES